MKITRLLKNIPEPPVGRHGVSVVLEAQRRYLKEHPEIIELPDGAMPRHVYPRIPHVYRVCSYYPGWRGRRARYGRTTFVLRRDLEKALESAPDGLHNWVPSRGAGFVRPTTKNNGARTVWRYTGRTWQKTATWKKGTDPVFRNTLYFSRAARHDAKLHGYRVQNCMDREGRSYHRVLAPDGQHYHSGGFLRLNEPGEVRKAVKAMIRTLRTRAKQDRISSELTSLAARVWVCPGDSIASGNCIPGTRRWMTAHGIPEGVGAVRGDYVLELENSTETRRAVAAAIERYRL